MPRWPWRRSAPDTPDVEKAQRAVTPAATFTVDQVAALLNAGGRQVTGSMAPLPRTDPQVAFGPGQPLFPSAIDPTRPDTGRTEPRFNEYPVSANLPGVTDRLVPWKVLRDAAGVGGLPRRCIEIRKAEVATLDWDIVISQNAVETAQRENPDRARADIEADLRDRLGPQISRCVQFWSKPDRGQGWTFGDWVSAVLEEHLVLDAVAIYPRYTRGGDLYSLEVVDGSCYSDDTEVLTKRGWLRFKDTTTEDYFATRNPKTRAFEWQQATYFHHAPGTGEMYHFKSRSLDLLVTGNHRMLVTAKPRALGGSRHRSPGEVIVSAADLAATGSGRKAMIPMTSCWDAPDLERFELPASGHTTSLGFASSGDDFAAFMGAYLAEGCFTGGSEVVISQMPFSKGYHEYQALLARILGRQPLHTGTNFVVSRKVLHDYLAQFGKAHEKYVPDIVKNMSARQLAIFWRFYMLGDGCYDGNREKIVTCSRRMAGDLQEIAQKIGKCANVSHEVFTTDTVMPDGRVIRAENKRDRYTVRLSNTQARTWNVERVQYQGDVYCVSVPNEILYVRRNGKAAWCGNTIKVLRDYRGGRPLPPQPAYQQMLYGFPRGEYVADADENGQIGNSYPADRLIYRRRNVRTFTPYGYSAVEQALADIDLWYRRRQWMGAEYTEGTVPQGLLETPVESMWTATQLKEYERDLNATYSGQTEERHRLRLLPPGLKLATNEDVAERYKPEYDLFLIKLVIAHFDTVATELGFSEAKGLGSSGWHEGQTDVAERRGRGPTLRWLQAVLSDISYNYLRMPPELEFKFLGLESEDEAAADQVAQNRIINARMTLNEDRDRQGLPRYPFPEADMPVMMTPRGLVFMDGASKVEQPGVLLAPPEGTQPGQAAQGDGGEQNGNGNGQTAGQQPKAGKSPVEDDGHATAVKTELAAYARWRKKNPDPRRPFQFELVTKADAPDLAEDPNAMLAEAGGVDPKAVEHPASAKYWPGWGRDLETVAVWVPRIRRAMREAIDTRVLAERWLAVRKADEPDPSAASLGGSAADAALTAAGAAEAVAWLHSHGANLDRAVALIRDLWTEGWAIGHQAALEMLTSQAVDWSAWTPGDPAAARLVLDENAGLEAMLSEADVTIRSIAATRLNQLARVLAGALERGDSPAQLAKALRDVLDDPQWADMVATTELNRAISQSTISTYQRNGIDAMVWLDAADQRVCPQCAENAAAGPVPVNGGEFPNGGAPPQHPSCRCALAPVVATAVEIDPASLISTAD